MNKDKCNSEGYYDPTPYKAIKHVKSEKDERVGKLIKTFQSIAHLAGYEIVGRIQVKDKKTGKVWR